MKKTNTINLSDDYIAIAKFYSLEKEFKEFKQYISERILCLCYRTESDLWSRMAWVCEEYGMKYAEREPIIGLYMSV